MTPVSPAELKSARRALTATSEALAATRSGRDDLIREANEAASAHWKRISEQFLSEAIASEG